MKVNVNAAFSYIVLQNDGEFVSVSKSLFGNGHLNLPRPLSNSSARSLLFLFTITTKNLLSFEVLTVKTLKTANSLEIT
jgi:hypothetical protein